MSRRLQSLGNLLIIYAAAVSVAHSGETKETLSGDCEAYADAYCYHAYSFVIDAVGPITLVLHSKSFDAYLMLVAPSGDVTKNDDGFSLKWSSKGNGQAAISIDRASVGQWTIVATTASPRKHGSYSLKYDGVNGIERTQRMSPEHNVAISRAFEARGIEDPNLRRQAFIDQLSLQSFRSALRTALATHRTSQVTADAEARKEMTSLQTRRAQLGTILKNGTVPSHQGADVLEALIQREIKEADRRIDVIAGGLAGRLALQEAITVALEELQALDATATERSAIEAVLVSGGPAADEGARDKLRVLREKELALASSFADRFLRSNLLSQLRLRGFQYVGRDTLERWAFEGRLPYRSSLELGEAYKEGGSRATWDKAIELYMAARDAMALPTGSGSMGHEGETDTSVWLPALLPWPPPDPSSRVVLSRSVLEGAGPVSTLGDMDARLVSALSAAGYGGPSYWGVPGGFAIVTPLEQTDAEGRPLDGRARWLASIAAMKAFTLVEYVKALLTAPAGYFRILMFVVSSEPFASSGGTAMLTTVQRWSRSGMNALPASVRVEPFTGEHTVTVQVYEFLKSRDDERPLTTIPGRLAAPDHLRAAHLISLVGG